MKLAPARKVALSVLSEVRRRQAYSRPVVDEMIGASHLSVQDAGMAVRLVYTAVAAQGILDDLIDDCAKRPGAVEPRVRDALRMSLGEILYLRTPSRAAVHQGVEAVRSVRPAAAGFANAVLRRIAERADAFPWGDPASDATALSRASAMPLWMVEVFLRDLGSQNGTAALLSSMEAAPVFARVNPYVAERGECLSVLEADGARPRQCPPDSESLQLQEARAAVHGNAVRDGLVIVSDAAAQVAPIACAPVPGSKVLDIGAGVGTKTAMLQGIAMRGGGPAEITAVDIHEFKLERLGATVARLGIPGVRTLVADATDPAQLEGDGELFDTVLVDAPCSGLGTLRRHPEKRWAIEPADIDRLATLQRAMLEAASRVVRPGGVVVYSTCTVTRAENEDVVAAFMADAPGRGYSVRSLGAIVPGEWQRFVTAEGYFRSWPESGGPDGHFVAALLRPTA